jgi:hypothetical protein
MFVIVAVTWCCRQKFDNPDMIGGTNTPAISPERAPPPPQDVASAANDAEKVVTTPASVAESRRVLWSPLYFPY